MSQADSSPLQRIQELARAREQKLAEEVSELSERQQLEEATLSRLGGYLEEYAGAGLQTPRRIHEVNNERRFIERLDKAVRQQGAQVERMVERTRQATERWLEARAEVKALGRLADLRQQQHQRELQRREQRDADAHNTQRRSHAPEFLQ